MSAVAAAGLETVRATRYVAPLREGGSLPALVEADDDGLYVLKFRGAGQGPRALIAELVAGQLGRLLGLPVPRIVLVELDPVLGRAEPDPEIQDLIAASAGVNIGLDYLPGALGLDTAQVGEIDPQLAAEVVWFDALVTNVDRTPRNPNLLLWHRRLWLIDHGAALYLQHDDGALPPLATRPFPAIGDHVLLPHAASAVEAGERLAPLVTRPALESVLSLVPDDWLERPHSRSDYVEYLEARAAALPPLAEEVERARGRD
jgi:hypothetical protein